MISLRKAALAATLGFGVLTTGAIASATATPATLAAMEVALPRAEDTTTPTDSARHPRAKAWLDSLTPERLAVSRSGQTHLNSLIALGFVRHPSGSRSSLYRMYHAV